MYNKNDEILEVYVSQWRNAVRDKLLSENFPIADTLELRTQYFDYGTQMAIMCSMNIFTQNIENYQWPTDWWQAVKARWFPKFALKQWPVIYTKINVKAIYPKAALPDPVFKVSLWIK
jgi:hypothetical protein